MCQEAVFGLRFDVFQVLKKTGFAGNLLTSDRRTRNDIFWFDTLFFFCEIGGI